MVGRDWVSRVSRHFRDGEYWCPPHRLMSLGPPDQDLKTWRSHEDVPPAGVLRGVKLDSRQRGQVRLPEHGEESEGESHLQGWTEVPQGGSDGAEAMEQWADVIGVAFAWRCRLPGASRTPGRTPVSLE